MLPQDYVEGISTSLTIQEGNFTECQHRVEYDKSGVNPSTNEGLGGPAPGNLRPGAGGSVATLSIYASRAAVHCMLGQGPV